MSVNASGEGGNPPAAREQLPVEVGRKYKRELVVLRDFLREKADRVRSDYKGAQMTIAVTALNACAEEIEEVLRICGG